MHIRPEQPDDASAIRRVHREAFGQVAESELVDGLRDAGALSVSLVADDQGVVGHIAFSPIELDAEIAALGLAPMAVIPDRQRDGIGSALVEAGLERCRELGVRAVVVLGHPEYYPRFGFVPAGRFGLRCRWPVPDDLFMAQELVAGALDGVSGLVRYHAEFDRFD